MRRVPQGLPRVLPGGPSGRPLGRPSGRPAPAQPAERGLSLAGRPVQVVAHRGASEDAPEHTLAAYLRAIELGTDALECDVRLTRDGHLVCVHDRKVDRTSSGRGVVSTLELAQLAELDWGSWGDTWEEVGEPEAPDHDRSGILTLERLLEVVCSYDRPVGLAIETKHPTRYAGLVERRLLTLLEQFGLQRGGAGGTQVRVMSFSWLSLRRVRRFAPRLPTVLLMERVPVRHWDGSLPMGVTTAGPEVDVLRDHPRYVARVARAGGAVHAWTVDEPADVETCLRLGVDAIITNRPGQVLRALGR